MPTATPVFRSIVVATRLVLTAVVGLHAVPAVAAPPAPALPTTEYRVESVKARFRTPKPWVRNPTQNGDPATLFLFDVAPKKKPQGVQFQQYLIVELTPAAPDQKTLADAVAVVRAEIEKMKPGVKFSKDEPVDYAGRSAHTFHWTFQRKLTYANPDGTTSISKVDTDRVTTVFLEHNTICRFGLVADTRFIPSLATKAEPVAKSLTWDD